jgi:hypothetical protein
MNNFYSVNLGEGFIYYFIEEDNAKKFLWNYYYDNFPEPEDNKTDKDIKEQLEQYGSIAGVGSIRKEYFEDA